MGQKVLVERSKIIGHWFPYKILEQVIHNVCSIQATNLESKLCDWTLQHQETAVQNLVSLDSVVDVCFGIH